MNAKILTGLCILLFVCSGSSSVDVKSHLSKIEYGADPSTYINKGGEVTIQVTLMGKKIDAADWQTINGEIAIESEPEDSSIPSSVSSGGTFSFTPEKDTWLILNYEGDDTYPKAEKNILIGVLYFSSPLVSSQFIMLFIILIIALLSYRLFMRRKLDITSLWREIRGE